MLKIKLSSTKDWILWRKNELPSKGFRPNDIPTNPNTVYKGNGFTTLGDFLGVDDSKYTMKEYLSYEQSKLFASKLGLRGIKEWNNYANGKYKKLPEKPNNIPYAPQNYYKKDGFTWFDFLHYSNKISINGITYKSIRNAKIKTGESRSSIRQKLNSDKFKNYKYLKK